MVRSLLLVAFVLVVSLLIDRTVLAEPGSPIKIGWVGPLSGDAAALGADSVEVIRHFIAETNRTGGIAGRTVELIVEDDQYNTTRALGALRKLVDIDKVSLIFAYTYGAVVAFGREAQRRGVVLIDPLDCDEQLAALPPLVFCVAKNTEMLGVLNAAHYLRRSFGPVGVMYHDGDPFFPKVAEATKRALEKGGIKVRLYEGILKGTDLKPLLTRARQEKLEALFMYGWEEMGAGFAQARALGLKGPIYSLGNIVQPGFKALAGSSLNGVVATSWFAPRSEAYTRFVDEFALRNGRKPYLDLSTVPSYDAARIALAALARAATSTTIEVDKLREALYATRNFPGVSGSITFDADGAVRSLKVGTYRYLDGELVAEAE